MLLATGADRLHAPTKPRGGEWTRPENHPGSSPDNTPMLWIVIHAQIRRNRGGRDPSREHMQSRQPTVIGACVNGVWVRTRAVTARLERPAPTTANPASPCSGQSVAACHHSGVHGQIGDVPAHRTLNVSGLGPALHLCLHWATRTGFGLWTAVEWPRTHPAVDTNANPIHEQGPSLGPTGGVPSNNGVRCLLLSTERGLQACCGTNHGNMLRSGLRDCLARDVQSSRRRCDHQRGSVR